MKINVTLGFMRMMKFMAVISVVALIVFVVMQILVQTDLKKGALPVTMSKAQDLESSVTAGLCLRNPETYV